MASFLIFVPNETRCEEAVLSELGLGALCADGGPDFIPVLGRGPGDQPGVVCAWCPSDRQDSNPALKVDLATQTWRPAKPIDGRPAARFWLGFETKRPVAPHDLRRRKFYSGLDVRLADGNLWEVPIAKLLPTRIGYDEKGNFGAHVRDEYADFCRETERFQEVLLKWNPAAENELRLVRAYEFAEMALGLNYRINGEVIDLLDLVWQEHIVNLIGAPAGLYLPDENTLQKKTSAG